MKSGKKYIIKFSKLAEKDKLKLKSSNLDKNCKTILNLMMDDPFCYPPSYEKLSGDLDGLYLRRINRQHRIVYEVVEEKKEIHIIRMWTHYDKINK
jgi:Txe/YoeB family toxin of toxin-antitoxin system